LEVTCAPPVIRHTPRLLQYWRFSRSLPANREEWQNSSIEIVKRARATQENKSRQPSAEKFDQTWMAGIEKMASNRKRISAAVEAAKEWTCTGVSICSFSGLN